MNEEFTKANETASQIEAFVHAHPVIALIIGVITCSWMLLSVIKGWLAPGPGRRRKLVTIDFAIAAVLGAMILHDQFPWHYLVLISLLCGGGSLVAYRVLAGGLCWFKPGLSKYLALPELAIEAETESGAAPSEPNPPTGDSK